MLKALEKCFYCRADRKAVRNCLMKYDKMRASNLINLDRLMKIGEEKFGYGSARYYQFLSSWAGLAEQGGALHLNYIEYGRSNLPMKYGRYVRRRKKVVW